ncbi:MAG TPA: hypothetical protein VHE30_21540 [Polyangiaceae bacterium]|nr:hypothetical protein [Polyangiaceae bacterium]
MQRSVRFVGTLVAVLAGAVPARADRVVLTGGTVLEGKASRSGDRVVVEVEAGTVTLPAAAVQKVEKSESPVDTFVQRYAALKPKDVSARLSLADYCRDHGMRGRERTLLAEVLELDTDNAIARGRLGYVKTPSGWVTEVEAMRAKGLVPHDGRFIPEAEARALERDEHASALDATRRAEQDDLDLERRRVERDRADLEAERVRLEADRQSASYSTAWFSYFTPAYRYGRFPVVDDCPQGRSCARRNAPRVSRPDTSLSVVKVPYSR